MMKENSESADTLKISVIGASGSGKSALIERLTDNTFGEHRPVPGNDMIKSTIVSKDNNPVELQLYEHKQLPQNKPNHNKSPLGHAVVIAFNPADKTSVKVAENIYQELKTGKYGQPRVCFAATRADQTNRTMAQNICNDLRKKTGCPAFLTSAKNGENINNLFINLSTKILKATGPTATATPKLTPSSSRSASATLSINDKNNFNRIWSNPKLQTNEQRVLALLNDYTKGGAFSRFLRGNWDHRHSEEVSAIIDHARKNQSSAGDILEKLKKIEIKNPDPDLEKTINYINSTLAVEQNSQQQQMKG